MLALLRRLASAEVRAMSQAEDYIVHLLLIPILGLALYQVVVDRIFGLAYTASSWVASLWSLSPQPSLMASASTITKAHVLLAMVFFAYFPFTKLVHFWTYPVNFLVRPRQSMRTVRYQFESQWELALRSDRSVLLYGLGTVAAVFLAAGALLGTAGRGDAPSTDGASKGEAGVLSGGGGRPLMGRALYVSQCARCHGLDGKGNGPGAASPKFPVAPRDLTDGVYRFVSTTSGEATDEDIAHVIRHGLPPSGMPSFASLREKQITSLVQVVRRLDKSIEKPGERIEVPPPPESATVAKGRKLYRANCAACHGQHGRGEGPGASALPVKPRDFTTGELKAGSSPEQIYLRIAAGIRPSGMPSFREQLAPEEIWSIVRYVREDLMPDKARGTD